MISQPAVTAIRRRSGAPRLAQLTALGRRYLEETAALRSGRAHFTDKLPNNFSHIGLIHAILPHATIIDARRHPMDACFSTFKQHFAEGQTFSYDLDDLGRYYRCYLSLMDHWDAVLPGKVLHVQYEELVREPEVEHPPAARALQAAIRSRLPHLPRDAPPRAHGERRAGAPAALQLRGGLLAALRAAARAAAARARRLPGALRLSHPGPAAMCCALIERSLTKDSCSKDDRGAPRGRGCCAPRRTSRVCKELSRGIGLMRSRSPYHATP